ncbi:MAG: penicillin-binding protein beta-lactamase classC [Sphingobacteriaceae bacterium]|nr:penicillin-binding protein beta-lactamase classC [Sphingobacteriaceae bacterium]
MKNRFFTTVLLAALSQTGFAQSFDKTRLDNYFNALEANNKFMGSVAVSKDGVIIYSKSVGFSDVEKKVKADESSKYRIGSISKTFTSVLVLKAIEDKKLVLNQTIDKYFPTIKNAEKITIEDLLRHRSGIHNFTNDKDYLTWNTQAKTENEMVEIIANGGSDFQPDSKASYSNSNFVLLSYILEKTFRKPYADLLQKYIIQPVGLTNTSFGGKINPNKNECKSYSFAETWKVEPETDMSVPMGAGGIVSTPGDLTKFSNALFNGKLLKPESLEIMKTVKDHYGIGLLPIPFYDKIGYGHTGGIDGFRSVFSYFSDGKIAYALTSNGEKFSTNDISIAVLSAVYGKPNDIPEFSNHKTYTVTSEELDKYPGVYASVQLPIKITITQENQALFAQATGQSAFPLEATGKDKFKFDKAGIVLEFNPSEKTMLLKQGGGKFTFTKE